MLTDLLILTFIELKQIIWKIASLNSLRDPYGNLRITTSGVR